ncbi:MAG: sodium-dependent bicarbonate transport family permease [Henriciella sp.]|nr:sodium-dependent bicarbonate transport family permease [Henriciella sp.]
MDVAISTLLSPIILFFALGMGAALLRSQMSVPEAFAKGLALYLMMAIGLKGGVEMSKNPLTVEVMLVLLAGVVLSFIVPAISYFFLRVTTKLDQTNAAATAAHYGSISIVTFVAATEAVRMSGLDSSGHMVAVAALMETPAIVTALFLANRGAKRETPVAGSERGELIREVALNASIVVLVGALIIGWIAGEEGTARVEPFFVGLFQGVLCLFLLDMGLSAGRGLRQGWRELSAATIGFGLYMPLVSAALAAIVVMMLGMDTGDGALLITLAASASYIAVPAAMRLALPKAKPSIYLTLSLGVTFPFNVTLGIPIYIYLAGLMSGAGG